MILDIGGSKGLLVDATLIGAGIVVLIFGLGFIAGYRVARR